MFAIRPHYCEKFLDNIEKETNKYFRKYCSGTNKHSC